MGMYLRTGKLMEDEGCFRKLCDVDSSPCRLWTDESLWSSPVKKGHSALPGTRGKGGTFSWEIYAQLLGKQGERQRAFLAVYCFSAAFSSKQSLCQSGIIWGCTVCFLSASYNSPTVSFLRDWKQFEGRTLSVCSPLYLHHCISRM